MQSCVTKKSENKNTNFILIKQDLCLLVFNLNKKYIAMLCFVAICFTVNNILIIIKMLSNLNKRSCNNHFFSAAAIHVTCKTVVPY